MTLLSRNTTSAERARGCVFSALFRDGESIARNGGTVTGTPAIDKGITLNGTTDYVTYDAVGSFFASSSISIVVEFWPDFAANANGLYYLFDSEGAGYYVQKRDNASNNVMRIILGMTFIDDIPYATYSSYWLTGQRNVLVVSSVSGATNAWLNGNQILVNDVTVWTPKLSSFLRIGARYDALVFFDGRITKFQIYDRLLTAGEAADFYNGAIYSYRNEPSLNLPFGMAQHNPTNTRSLDVSGNARHATLVGTPTKLGDRPGYELNGSTQYMTVVGTGVFNAAGVTIAVEFTPDFAANANKGYMLFDSTTLNRYLVYKFNNAGSNGLLAYLGDSSLITIAYAAYSPYWFKGRKNLLVISGATGATNVWLNGNLIGTSATAWTAKNPTNIFIGISQGGADHFDGKIHSFRVWREALTPLQVADLC